MRQFVFRSPFSPPPLPRPSQSATLPCPLSLLSISFLPPFHFSSPCSAFKSASLLVPFLRSPLLSCFSSVSSVSSSFSSSSPFTLPATSVSRADGFYICGDSNSVAGCHSLFLLFFVSLLSPCDILSRLIYSISYYYGLLLIIRYPLSGSF